MGRSFATPDGFQVERDRIEKAILGVFRSLGFFNWTQIRPRILGIFPNFGVLGKTLPHTLKDENLPLK